MKRTLCFIILLFFISVSCNAAGISAKSAYLFDCFTQETVFEKDPDKQLPIASTTKIMTGVLACELYDPDFRVIVKPEWCNIECSSMYLEAGEQLQVKNLIYGLLLMSGNDAAEALASLYSGDKNDFVDLMNGKAEEIGLKNTHFTNPSGLDDTDHFSSARDLTILTEYALNNRLFASVVATPQKEVGKRFMLNHNKLLFTLSGAIGVKTGWTDSAGRCLVSAVERNGRRVIAVTLDAPDDWNDHEVLYAEAYYGIRMRTLASKGIIGNAYVAGIKSTPVCIKNDLTLFLSDEEFSEIQYRLIGDRIVYGNVKKGDKYGELQVILNGRPVVTEPVFFTEDIIYFEPEKSLFQKIFKG